MKLSRAEKKYLQYYIEEIHEYLTADFNPLDGDEVDAVADYIRDQLNKLNANN